MNCPLRALCSSFSASVSAPGEGVVPFLSFGCHPGAAAAVIVLDVFEGPQTSRCSTTPLSGGAATTATTENGAEQPQSLVQQVRKCLNDKKAERERERERQRREEGHCVPPGLLCPARVGQTDSQTRVYFRAECITCRLLDGGGNGSSFTVDQPPGISQVKVPDQRGSSRCRHVSRRGSQLVL